jgi:hypothetical protein
VSARRLGGLAVVLALVSGPARAHVLFERPTLRQWLAAADLALVVEFEGDVRIWEAPDGRDRQEFFRVRVVEALRGAAPGPSLEFFPHAEGFPRFRAGDRALLFLERTRDRIEFTSLAARFPWLSGQGAGQEWILAGDDGAAIREVARRFVALRRDGAPDPKAALREMLLAELGSGVARLRADALTELMVLRTLPGFLDAGTTAALAAWAESPSLPPGQQRALAQLLRGAPAAAGRRAQLASPAPIRSTKLSW